MHEKLIYEFEGTELEQELDEWISNANWEDEIYINPVNEILRIEESQIELFHKQNKDLSGWTRVIWGNKCNED